MIQTYFEHRAEHTLVVDGGTIPSSVPELMLTLGHAVFRALGHAGHVIHGQLAEFSLTLRQSPQAGTNLGCSGVERLHRLRRFQFRKVSQTQVSVEY